jgi:hypothetical protein
MDIHTGNGQAERAGKVRSHLGLAFGLHRFNIDDLHACPGPERSPGRHVGYVEIVIAGSRQPEGQICGRTRHECYGHRDWAREVAG